jgi:hypothetical protein
MLMVLLQPGINRMVRLPNADLIALTGDAVYAWHLATFNAGILFGLFDPEDGGEMFLQNVS